MMGQMLAQGQQPAAGFSFSGFFPEDEVFRLLLHWPRRKVKAGPPPLTFPSSQAPLWPKVRGLARGITVNGDPYPRHGLERAHVLPQRQGIHHITPHSQPRADPRLPRSSRRRIVDCADSEAYLDFTPFKGEYAKPGLPNTRFRASPAANRGTGQFAGPEHAASRPPSTSP